MVVRQSDMYANLRGRRSDRNLVQIVRAHVCVHYVIELLPQVTSMARQRTPNPKMPLYGTGRRLRREDYP
eukprot:2323469-Pyramimonas_sp.AAC.2